MSLDFISIINPETELEAKILTLPAVQTGMVWGKPRFGHPEGEVYKHVRDVLDNIDLLKVPEKERSRLRLITILHDTFKFQEDLGFPRHWSKHHGFIAADFASEFISDPGIIDVIRWHDEAFYAWRISVMLGREESGEKRLQNLLSVLGENTELFYHFFCV